jgi:hypothetical protein
MSADDWKCARCGTTIPLEHPAFQVVRSNHVGICNLNAKARMSPEQRIALYWAERDARKP